VHIGTIFFEPDGFSPLGEGFTLTPSLIHPRSVGTLRLRSDDIEEKPIIRANYLTDPEEYDLNQLVAGIKFVRNLGKEMIEMNGQGCEVYPGPEYQTDEELKTYIRRFSGSMYHPACSCRMGHEKDPFAVLDSQLRVRGVQSLRVVDASSMPELPGKCTCI